MESRLGLNCYFGRCWSARSAAGSGSGFDSAARSGPDSGSGFDSGSAARFRSAAAHSHSAAAHSRSAADRSHSAVDRYYPDSAEGFAVAEERSAEEQGLAGHYRRAEPWMRMRGKVVKSVRAGAKEERDKERMHRGVDVVDDESNVVPDDGESSPDA